MKILTPAKQAKALVQDFGREEALAFVQGKLFGVKDSSEMRDIEAAMIWREVLVFVLAAKKEQRNGERP